MSINHYSYEELSAAATAPSATQADIDALGEWFSLYGDRDWNGEYYDADGFSVYPIYKWDKETDQGEIVRWEIR